MIIEQNLNMAPIDFFPSVGSFARLKNLTLCVINPEAKTLGNECVLLLSNLLHLSVVQRKECIF